MRYKNRHPIDILQLMAEQVEEHDWCIKCGYQFGYDQEGCDECEPITAVLQAAERTFPTEVG